MTRELWVNLPVKDIGRSKEFFTKLGFPLHPRHADSEEMAGLVIGDKGFMVMLFLESVFKSFTGNDITDTTQSTEVLFSFDAESKEEVDELIRKAAGAGGTIIRQPGGNNHMYGAVFADPDGHCWNILYMG